MNTGVGERVYTHLTKAGVFRGGIIDFEAADRVITQITHAIFEEPSIPDNELREKLELVASCILGLLVQSQRNVRDALDRLTLLGGTLQQKGN